MSVLFAEPSEYQSSDLRTTEELSIGQACSELGSNGQDSSSRFPSFPSLTPQSGQSGMSSTFTFPGHNRPSTRGTRGPYTCARFSNEWNTSDDDLGRGLLVPGFQQASLPSVGYICTLSTGMMGNGDLGRAHWKALGASIVANKSAPASTP